MPDNWDQYRKEIHGKQDWIGAANGEYGEYLYRARERFKKGEAITVQEIKDIYRRVAEQLRSEIEKTTLAPLRKTHLTALSGCLEKAAKTLNQDVLDAITAGIRLAVDEAESGPEQVTKEILEGVFDKTEVKWLFADISERAVASLLSRTKYDGLKLSDRVWRTSQHARTSLQKIVEDGVTRGLDSRKLAKQVQQYLQPGVWTVMKAETRRRLGVSKDVSYEAMRLARTEMNNAFHEGTVNSYQAVPSSKGIYWRLSGSHPLPDVCDDYASHNGNGFWPKGEEPARPHPQCLCVILPAMEETESFKERLKQWMQDPTSQPDLEEWYNGTARRFLKRPSPSSFEKLEAQPKRFDIPYSPSPEQIQKVGNKVGNEINRLAKKRGRNPNEIEEEVRNKVGKLLQKQPSIRVTPEGAMKIFEDGRFKSQFEVRGSGGAYAPEYRAACELKGMGAPIDLDVTQRPIYGYIPIDGRDWVDHYGSVEFVLKQEVKKRTTFTLGDSLDAFGRELVVASPVHDPQRVSWGEQIESMVKNGRPGLYLEAQIHCGVSVDDIEKIRLHTQINKGKLEAKLREIATGRGIPIEEVYDE